MSLHSIIRSVFGDPSDKRLKSYQRELQKVIELYEQFVTEVQSIEDIQLRMQNLRTKFVELNYKDPSDLKTIRTLTEDSKYEVFALHKRASELIMGQEYELADGSLATWKMIPYDVQIVGAMALIDGNIAEMRTGEGKTFVATLAASLAAIA